MAAPPRSGRRSRCTDQSPRSARRAADPRAPGRSSTAACADRARAADRAGCAPRRARRRLAAQASARWRARPSGIHTAVRARHAALGRDDDAAAIAGPRRQRARDQPLVVPDRPPRRARRRRPCPAGGRRRRARRGCTAMARPSSRSACGRQAHAAHADARQAESGRRHGESLWQLPAPVGHASSLREVGDRLWRTEAAHDQPPVERVRAVLGDRRARRVRGRAHRRANRDRHDRVADARARVGDAPAPAAGRQRARVPRILRQVLRRARLPAVLPALGRQ